jgi:hypothetical protein
MIALVFIWAHSHSGASLGLRGEAMEETSKQLSATGGCTGPSPLFTCCVVWDVFCLFQASTSAFQNGRTGPGEVGLHPALIA